MTGSARSARDNLQWAQFNDAGSAGKSVNQGKADYVKLALLLVCGALLTHYTPAWTYGQLDA